MIPNLSNFINRIANWKSLLLFLALYMFFSGYVLKNAEAKINELAGKTVGIIDLTFGFDPQKTLTMVADYGDAGRACYSKTEMTADVAYPIIYAFLFGIILSLLYRRKPYSWVNVLPFITMLFDYGENLNVITLLNSFPQQSNTIAVLCELFKLLKWTSLGICILLILWGLINLLLGRLKSSTQ
ncbi:MAG: hypothetical protein ABI851_12500 [Saprospiraceae bacterium]